MANKKNYILVTGGAGYIGSQAVRELMSAGCKPVVYDNMSTGHKESIPGVELIVGDLLDTKKLTEVFQRFQPEAVLHFAASLEVEESVNNPQKYFNNNIVNGLNLLNVMVSSNVKKMIFSSSAAVYGNPEKLPVCEEDLKRPLNPYGLTKLMFEQILDSYKEAYGLKSISLRYFNASGADLDGNFGQDNPKPTHLTTRVILTALGKYPSVEIYGTDYPTKDGSCVRDYIHIKDLALAHISALEALDKDNFSPAYNLGTASGFSVKEVIEMTKKITDKDFKVIEKEKRLGDPTSLIASNKKAKDELGFQPRYSDLKTIIESAWCWHKNHPDGYKK